MIQESKPIAAEMETPKKKNGVITERTGPQVTCSNGYGYWERQAFGDPYLRFGAENIDGYTAADWWRKLEFMKRDPTLALLRQAFIGRIVGGSWTVKHEDDVPPEMIEFAEYEMAAIRDELMRSAGLGCFDWGWAPYEIVHKIRDDGMVGIDKVKSLLQQNTIIEIDERTGAFTGLSQEEIFLDPPECLLFNFDVVGTNWYGTSTMRIAEGPFDSALRIDISRDKLNGRIASAHWAIYYPVGTTPIDGIETDNFQLANDIMEKLLSSGSLVLPNEIKSGIEALNDNLTDENAMAWRVEQFTAGNSSSDYYLAQLKYEDTLKARATGIPERSVFEGQYGTKAEAETHGDVGVVGTELRMNELTKTISKYLLQDLIEVNFGAEWVGKITLVANPMIDAQKVAYAQLYEKFLSNSDVLIEEYETLDMRELTDYLGIPKLEEGERNELDTAADDQPAPGVPVDNADQPTETDEDDNG